MNGSGGTEEEEDEAAAPLPSFSAAAGARVALTCVLFVASAGCNGAVLWAAARAPAPRPRVRLLMANLAAADLLVTLVVMPLDAAWNATVQWRGGEAACRALMFLKLAAMYAAAFATVAIALERHAAIVRPLGAGPRRGRAPLLGAAWALSALLALPQAFVFRTVRRARPRRFVQCATVGSFAARWHETLYNMFTFACLFLLPLLVMVLCYGRILVAISGRTRDAGASSRGIQLRRSCGNIPRARMRTLRMSIAIVLTFVLCWTPYYLLGLWYWFSPEMLTREKVPPALSHILFLFGLFNTCLDPLVYGLFTARFRRELRGACRCGRRRHERDAAVPSARSGSVSAPRDAEGGAAPTGKLQLEVPAGAAAAPGPRCQLCRRGTGQSFM